MRMLPPKAAGAHHGLLLDVLGGLLDDVQQAPDAARPAVEQLGRGAALQEAHHARRPVDARGQRARHHHLRQPLLRLRARARVGLRV